MRFKDVSLPIGDLARDAKSDRSFPKGNLDWETLEKYIKSVNPQNPEFNVFTN